jgi:two-component system C4-dicarboxylate transport sensor histidine kinase DctB
MQQQLRLRLIEVTLDMDPQAPMVLGNPIQLEQVFMNLLTNARDAVSDAAERRICISTAVSGDDVVITVKDTGEGIAEGLEQRIFDPFFTTKDVGKGTGLGLSITYSIIQEHHGDLGVENGADGVWGAVFTITMPLLQGTPGEEPKWATES